MKNILLITTVVCILLLVLLINSAMAEPLKCDTRNTEHCRLVRLEQKMDKLLGMWFYPPPISYDGKQTWVRIDPSLVRKMDELKVEVRALQESDKK